MRVLLVTPFFVPAWGYGGPIRAVLNLARGLARAGASVEVVTTDADPSGRTGVPQVREEDGVVIRTFPRSLPKMPKVGTYFHAVGLRRHVENTVGAFDVVHVNGLFVWSTVATARACVRQGVPFIVSPRGALDAWGLVRKRAKKRIYLRLVERRTISDAAAIHFTGSSERDGAPPWARMKRAVVVPNAAEFVPHVEGETWRVRHGFGLGEVVVGIVGRVHPQKGHDLLFEAMSRLPEEGRPRLAVVGDGEPSHLAAARETVQRLALHRQVVFTGLLRGAEIAEAYAGIDLLAVPSEGESFGNVVVESLAQECRVAVAPHVGLAEWLVATGTGEVVSREPSAWADLLARTLMTGRVRCGGLRSVAKAEFDLDAVGRRMIEAYREVVDGDGR